MTEAVRNRNQDGAVILTACLMLLFLLGFMGIALDFGRLFIVKTELQTAMDSCALAGAQELDGQPDAWTRARNAGMTAGNMNPVELQSANWRGMGQITDATITFKNAGYDPAANPAETRYVQCEHTQTGIRMWLLHALGAFFNDAATYPQTRNVLARAVATRTSAQTTCPIPVALKPKSATDPNYGFAIGEWITMLTKQSSIPGGYIGWANLDGSNDANQTKKEMEGSCGTSIGDELGTPGTQTAIAEVWNERFGIYKNKGDSSTQDPDYTGYVYTTSSWPSASNAYEDFLNKRQAFAPCAADVPSCASINNLKLNSFQGMATTSEHRNYGSNRRIVLVPVVEGMRVSGFACMLLLQPLSIPMDDVQLEYLGNASAPNSPCTTSGLPGGSAGPLVSALVE